MSPAIPEVIFDVRRISDEDLATIRSLCVREILGQYPTFGQWLHEWCDYEQSQRAKGTDERLTKHCLFVPPLPEWSDSEVGDALGGVTKLAFYPKTASFCEIFDRLLVCVAIAASERLCRGGVA
jgi:hypothetical protein